MKLQVLNQVFTRPHLYIGIVAVGIFLKFYKLEEQFFWDDEICTVLHVSGISLEEEEARIPVNQVIPKKYFDDLIRLNSRDLSLADQFIGLSKMPQLTPGHYYYFIFLGRIFGDDLMLYRYFSVFVFLLSIPFLFLLTQRLSNSSLAGWLVISIYSVSPIFQMYAQEGRYYALWGSSIIILHYLFLRALDKQSVTSWLVYVVVGFFAIHVTILVYIVLLAQFIYGMVYHRHEWKSLIASQLAVGLTSVPWLAYAYNGKGAIQESLSWHQFGASDYSIFRLLYMQLENAVGSFIYVNNNDMSEFLSSTIFWIYLLLIVCSIVFFFLLATPKQRWYIGLMVFLGGILLVSADLYRSTVASIWARYSLTNFIGIFVLVGFVLYKGINRFPLAIGPLFIAMACLGLQSSWIVANDTNYGKRSDAFYQQKDARERFSGDERILILSDFTIIYTHWYTGFMALTNASTNPNIDIIYAKPEYPNYQQKFDYKSYDKVYVMNASQGLLSHLRATHKEGAMELLEERIIYGAFDISLYGITD